MRKYIILIIISWINTQTLPPDVIGKYQGTQDKYVYYANNRPNEIPKSDWEMVISTAGVDFSQVSGFGTFNYSGNYSITEKNNEKSIVAKVKEEKSGGEYELQLTLLYKENKPYWVMKAADKTPDVILLKIEQNLENIDVTLSEESMKSVDSNVDQSGSGVFAFCPSCGFPNKNKFVFCPRCGSDLKLEGEEDNIIKEEETSKSVLDLEASMVDTPVEAHQIKDIPIEVGQLVQPPKIAGQYTIQIASKPTIHEARGVQDNLIDDGFNSYLQEVKFSDNNDIWYRIRVGKYRKRDRAQSTRNKVATIYGNDVWVDNVRMDID